jgi:hypothetical protein
VDHNTLEEEPETAESVKKRSDHLNYDHTFEKQPLKGARELM